MTIYALLGLAMIILICIGVPVGFGAGIISMIGAGYFFGDLMDPRTFSMIARLAYAKIDDFLLLAIPFFLLAGRLMNTGGITNRLFDFVSLTVQPLKGGLGHANVLASMIFAGMSGSATADAVGLGTVEMKAMLDNGYDRDFSAAITAATSLIGPIIPPSIALVAYGVMAEVSVGKLFVAGIIPGLLMAFSFMAYVAYCAWRYNYPSGPFAPLGALGKAFLRGFFPLMTPIIIVGGIYLGVFTPTEAAAVAAFYAMILGIFVLPRIRLATPAARDSRNHDRQCCHHAHYRVHLILRCRHDTRTGAKCTGRSADVDDLRSDNPSVPVYRVLVDRRLLHGTNSGNPDPHPNSVAGRREFRHRSRAFWDRHDPRSDPRTADATGRHGPLCVG